MRFVADPSGVGVGPIAWIFLATMLLLLPVAVLRQHRALGAGTAVPSRREIYLGAVVTHAFMLSLAWFVCLAERLDLLPPYRPTLLHALVGLIALGVGLLPLLERFRRRDPAEEERLRLIAPRTPREHGLFYLLSLTAGIAEEFAYRGLLFTLLAAVFGGWWIAALVGAAAFGIVHLFQGWKGAGLAGLMGLREQLVVGLTGTLFVAMAVHMLHDAIAGTFISLRARRDALGGEAIAVS